MNQKIISAGLFLLLFYFFLYAPLIALLYPLLSYNGNNFINALYDLFNDAEFTSSLFNSFFISLCAVGLTLLLSLIGLYYIFLGGNVKKIEYLFYPSMTIPEIIYAISMVILFSFFQIPLGTSTLIITYSTIYIGYSYAFLLQKWNEFDKTLIIAGTDLGASYFSIWKKIIIPTFQGTFLGSSLLVFIISFDDYIFAYFCGNSETVTLPLYILLLLRSGITTELRIIVLLLMLFSFIIGIAYSIYSYQLYKKNRMISHGNTEDN